MNTVVDIVFELIRKYPHKEYCSRARIQRLVFLADWWMLLHRQRRLIDLNWVFDNRRGPVNVELVATIERATSIFAYQDEINIETGRVRRLFRIVNEKYTPNLDADAADAIDTVVSVTQEMPWVEFNSFVHSTYPLMNGQRNSVLDMKNLVEAYKVYVESIK